jgi:hypothetical protein
MAGMEFCAIKRAGGSIALDEWKQIIAAHSALEEVPPRTGTNPFTNEQVIFIANGGAAYYVENGRKVGNLSYEDGEIKGTGIPVHVCEEISALLRAEFCEDYRS